MIEDSELLCSPRKIRRLGSSTGKIGANQKLSQESRATSTPAKKSLSQQFSISSDISSINQDTSARFARTCTNATEESINSDLLSLFDECSLNGSPESVFLNRPNPKVFRGKAWNFFKPKFQESLYFKVMGNFDNIEDTVFEYLEELRSDERKGTLTLIKFFVDICGYQTAQVEKHFDFDKDFSISCEKVIKLMEFDFVTEEILDAKTHIFFEADRNSKLGTTLASAVNNCLEKIMIGAYGQNMLFTKPFHKYIFQFLSYMCQSILRPIRHTGITLVRMTLKVLNYIYPRILKKLDLGDSQHEHSHLPVEKELEYVEKYIKHFYGIFSKNSFIPDVKLNFMRSKNVKEMGRWMIELPQVYFVNSIAHLYKLTLDESHVVRLSAVQVCKNLIKNKSVHLHVVEYLGDVVRLVQGRLRDIQLIIVVEAVDFFSVLVDHYPKAIGEDIVCDITELLYANSYSYAKAAGFFTIKFLNSAKLPEKEMLKKLVNITSIPKFQKMKPFFVEAFMEHDTVLGNYKLMMEVVLSCEKENGNEYQYTLDLFELMYYSIYQKLKGQCLMKRTHSIAVDPPSSCHEEIAKLFLLNLKHLVDLFRDKIDMLNYLLKILIIVDFEVLTSSYRPHLIFLTKSCRVLLLNENDEELLGNICNLFHYLGFEKNTCLKDDLQRVLVNLFENLSMYLEGYLEEEAQEMALDLHFEKIGKLYEKFDMNKFFKWNGIFTVWGTVPLSRGQMITCQHFILWTMKELREKSDQQNRMKIITLNHHFSEYTASLVQLMTTPETNEELKLDAFESFCFLHWSAYKIAMKREVEDFKLQTLQSLKTHVPGTLDKFFKDSIIHNKSATFERREKLIRDWLALILNALMDVFYMIPLFECYHTRSEEYGTLIEWVAAKIFERKKEVFFQLTVVTLAKSAEHVFQTLVRSLSSPEARELMALAVKLSNMKQFSNASEEVLKMLQLGFQHCFKVELFELLVLLQSFLPKLSEEHYKACLQSFKAMTPTEFENQEYVKSFRAKLEADKRKVIFKKKVANKNISSSDTLQDSNKSKSKSESTPKKRGKKRNSIKSKTKKTKASNESPKENSEEVRPLKKNKTTESKKTNKK